MSSLEEFNETLFRTNVDDVLKVVERLLDATKQKTNSGVPTTLDQADHVYSNKYDVVDLFTNSTIIAILNIFNAMGLTINVWNQMLLATPSFPWTIQLQTQDSCEFVKQQIVNVPVVKGKKKSTKRNASGDIVKETSTISQVEYEVTEYHWKITVKWQLFLFHGANPKTNDNAKRIVLQNHEMSSIIITQESNPPIPEYTFHPVEDTSLSLSWIMQQINLTKGTSHFRIHREQAKTPTNNEQIEQALDFVVVLGHWAKYCTFRFTEGIETRIMNKHHPATPDASTDESYYNLLNCKHLFSPLVPLMMKQKDEKDEMNVEEDEKEAADSLMNVKPDSWTMVESTDTSDAHLPSTTAAAAAAAAAAASPSESAIELPVVTMDTTPSSNENTEQSPLLPNVLVIKLLNEHVRSIHEKQEEMTKKYPSTTSVDTEENAISTTTSKLVTSHEATFITMCAWMNKLVRDYQNGCLYMGVLLRRQLFAAIGKELKTDDLDQFVRYHNTKLLRTPPKHFCHAIRRPNHYPEGIISIERIKNDSSSDEPIHTLVQPVAASDPSQALQIPLNAATTVQLAGEKYLHGWIQHRFADSEDKFQLTARARQFSCFILIIGTMVGPNQLEPKDAIIVQNKDELLIPLNVNELPTPKEFKDAIVSLSPEQQRFAKAFRSMQLASSVFGMCVVQIKPQLEALLKLPDDALTKEMKLTQDLMELFIKYQVPSDLLSYDGSIDATTSDKVGNVRDHVKGVMDVIEGARAKDKKEAEDLIDLDEQRDVMQQYEGAFTIRKSKKKARGIPRSFLSFPPPLTETAVEFDPSAFGFSDNVGHEVSIPESGTVYGATLAAGSSSNFRNEIMTDSQQETFSNNNINNNDSIQDSRRPHTATPRPSLSSAVAVDVTTIPKLLDSTFETHDCDNALRSTTIDTSSMWTRYRQENLLTEPKKNRVFKEDIKTEKNKAFDLLDALSRSGSLPIACSELHVIVAVTHRFDNTVVGTVIEDNINPIEKLEKSTLLIASTIYGTSASELVNDTSTLKRLQETSPELFDAK